MTARVQIFPGRLKAYLADHFNQAFDRYGTLLSKTIRVMIRTQYPPASTPGEHPHRRSGNLQQSITWERWRAGDVIYLVVGSDMMPRKGQPRPVSWYVEWGTRHMLERPYIRPLYDATKNDLIRFLNARGIRAKWVR